MKLANFSNSQLFPSLSPHKLKWLPRCREVKETYFFPHPLPCQPFKVGFFFRSLTGLGNNGTEISVSTHNRVYVWKAWDKGVGSCPKCQHLGSHTQVLPTLNKQESVTLRPTELHLISRMPVPGILVPDSKP